MILSKVKLKCRTQMNFNNYMKKIPNKVWLKRKRKKEQCISYPIHTQIWVGLLLLMTILKEKILAGCVGQFKTF